MLAFSQVYVWTAPTASAPIVVLHSGARASVTATSTKSSSPSFVTLISNTAFAPDSTVWVSSVASVWVVFPSESASFLEYFSILMLGLFGVTLILAGSWSSSSSPASQVPLLLVSPVPSNLSSELGSTSVLSFPPWQSLLLSLSGVESISVYGSHVPLISAQLIKVPSVAVTLKVIVTVLIWPADILPIVLVALFPDSVQLTSCKVKPVGI